MGRPLAPKVKGYLRRPLDRIFSVAANVPVLRALGGMTRGTGRDVARRAGIGAQAAHQALARLEEYGLVRRFPAGRAYVFELNREHFFVKNVALPMFEAEASFREDLGRVLAKAAGPDLLSGAIFGSVARGEEGPGSDFDVCLVVERARAKDGLEARVSREFERIWKEYGLKLSALVFTRTEFAKGYRVGRGLFRNVVSEGEVFHGIDLKEVIGGKEGSKAEGGFRRGGKLRRRGS